MSTLAMMIPSIIQAGVGAAQLIGGSRMSRTPQPEYEIPGAITEATTLARRSAQGDIPGLQAMQEAQRVNTANQLASMEKYGIIDPNAVSRAYNQESQALGNIGLQNALYRTREKDKYAAALNVMGQEQANQWQWDKAMPWQDKMEAASALQGAGMQNIMTGLQSGADYFGQRDMMKTLGYNVPNMFGSTQQATNPMGNMSNVYAYGGRPDLAYMTPQTSQAYNMLNPGFTNVFPN